MPKLRVDTGEQHPEGVFPMCAIVDVIWHTQMEMKYQGVTRFEDRIELVFKSSEGTVVHFYNAKISPRSNLGKLLSQIAPLQDMPEELEIRDVLCPHSWKLVITHNEGWANVESVSLDKKGDLPF